MFTVNSGRYLSLNIILSNKGNSCNIYNIALFSDQIHKNVMLNLPKDTNHHMHSCKLTQMIDISIGQ